MGSYVNQYANFVNDKHGFFSTVNTSNDAKTQAENHNFQFLSDNKMLIEEEFNQLFAVLKETRDSREKREQFWLYCYYCSAMLHAYYIAYDKADKIAEYEELEQQLKERCETKQFPRKKVNDDSFIAMLGKKISASLVDLSEAPEHASSLRNKIGLPNLIRIYWTFCRLTLKSSFLLAKDAQWLAQLGKLLGKNIDVEFIVKELEAPSGVFRALSVGFFVARIILNTGIVLKHTFAPTEQEKTISMGKRFTNELYKRHADILNDAVWGTINLLTNYAPIFHIAAPVAGWITAGFLVFDICLLLWRRRLAEQEYLTKKSQYTTELIFYQEELRKSLDNDTQLKNSEHCAVLIQQLTELEINWQTKSATYLFNAAAALLLAVGFAASMIFTPAVLIAGSYVVCTFAVAMYLSDAQYSQYKEKDERLKHLKLAHKDTTQALTEQKAARNEFLYTLLKNAIVPSVVIATFAVCWQAALVLTAVYLAYELWRAYQKHKQAVAPKALQSEVDEEEQLAQEPCFACC